MQTTGYRRIRAAICLLLSYGFVISLSTLTLTPHTIASPAPKPTSGITRPAALVTSTQDPERRAGELLLRFRSGVASQNKERAHVSRLRSDEGDELRRR
jgi:hypothetical protein